MNKVASDLLLLTTNLSQLEDQKKLIQLFIEATQTIFNDHTLQWISNEAVQTDSTIAVRTPKKNYGYIRLNKSLIENILLFPLFQNAVQLLAIFIEKLEQDTQLNNQTMHLRQLVDEQTNHLIQKQDELNEMNEEFATINEELIGTNQSLQKVNVQFQNEIAEHENTEKQLRDSDKFFKYSNDMLCIAGFDGYFKKINPAWSKTLGWSSEELLAKPWNSFVHPDDIESTNNVKSTIVDGREIYQFENRYICKNGTVKWLSWSSFPYPEEGLMFGVARDISHIKDTEAKFRSIVHSSPNGIYFYQLSKNNELIFSGANPSADKIIGIDHRMLIGKTIQEAFPKLAKTDVPELYTKIAKGEIDTANFEIDYTDHKIHGYFQVTAYQSNAGMVVVEFMDILERKKVELKLQESERLLTESQRISGIGSYTLNIVRGIWSGSSVLDEMFEFEATDDHSIEGWLAIIHPDDREMMAHYFANDVIGKKSRFDKIYRIQTQKSKKTHWVHGIGELEFSPNGTPLKMIGTIQNITYRVEAEDKLRLLTRAIDQSPDSIVITNSKAEIEYVNPVIEKLSGYTKEELIGKNPRIFSSGKTSKEEYKKLWDQITSGKVWQGEFQNRKKSGELYWESASISPVLNNEGKITHYLAIREDITEQKKLTGELIKAKEQAEESDRLKSSFLANMSHEIRTPMNSIMGFASLMPEEESKELINQYANIIIQNAEQLVSLIDSIVIYSKLQTGLFAFNPKEFEVNTLLNDIQQSFNLPIFQKDVTLKFEHNFSAMSTIKSDYEKLRQIITNLITNAFKYTCKGEIIVGGNLKNGEYNFWVKDTGIGIPEKDADHIFDRFYRGSNVNEAIIRGTGLGLSIVKELVVMLGGKIWVESEVGKGSTFYFTIPSHH